jgi:hypothetical protein
VSSESTYSVALQFTRSSSAACSATPPAASPAGLIIGARALRSHVAAALRAMPGTVAHAAVVAAGARATAGLAGRAACVFTQPVCRRVGSRIEGPAADTGGARVVHRERAVRRGGEQGAANRRVGGRLRREGHIGRVSEACRERQLDMADTGARAVDGDALLEHVIRGAAIAGRDGPETATFVRSVALQDRLNVAKPYGIGQETVHTCMPGEPPPLLQAAKNAQQATTGTRSEAWVPFEESIAIGW